MDGMIPQLVQPNVLLRTPDTEAALMRAVSVLLLMARGEGSLHIGSVDRLPPYAARFRRLAGFQHDLPEEKLDPSASFGFEFGTLVRIARIVRQARGLVGLMQIPSDQRHGDPLCDFGRADPLIDSAGGCMCKTEH
jgi:hypothetical protein